MKISTLYLAAILGLSCLTALAQERFCSLDIINLEDFISLGKKEKGTNEGGLYSDSYGSKWFIKKATRSKALISHEYIVGKLLRELKPECFATIELVDSHPDKVASKFLEGFVPYRNHHVKHAGELTQKHETIGMELLLVVRDWLGIEDENPGNIGTIPWENDTLHFTRIDYDTAFYFNTYTLHPINLKTKGIETLDEDALIEAFGLIADMPNSQLEETLNEIYFNIDKVGVSFSSEERKKLEYYLFSRKQEFSLIRKAFSVNKDILKHINEGNIEAAQTLYNSSNEQIQEFIQREWLLNHYTRTRSTYTKLIAIFPEILESAECITDKNGYNPLHLAIEWEDTNLIDLIIESASEIEALIMAQDNRGFTPLHLAAQKGLSKFIASILKYSLAPLSIKTDKGYTPLHLAAENNRLEATTLLIDASSEIEAVNEEGNTPLLLATQEGAIETILLLIKNNADLLQSNHKGETALHLAVRSNSKAIVDRLIEVRPSLIIRENRQGMTPLHTAVIEGNYYAIHILLQEGADPCTEDNRGFSAIDLAILMSIDMAAFDPQKLCL